MIRVSTLPLLAYKVGPNLFDLSSNLHHVSMRDQMHRAVVLAEALVAGNQFEPRGQVLIVGAGVAGVVAGMVLARHNLDVQIVDNCARAPFGLQRGVTTRYVGPYMYEWPLTIYGCQKMPPPQSEALFPWTLNKQRVLSVTSNLPVHPDYLVTGWESELRKAISNSTGRLRLQVGINSAATNQQVKRWLHAQRNIHKRRHPRKHGCSVIISQGKPWGNSHVPFNNLKPQFVLLAAGMGVEKNEVTDVHGSPLLTGKKFWSNDDIRKPNCGLRTLPRIVVIGGGDGGLQDALRAATIDDHPLITWDRLLAADLNHVLPKQLADIQAMESQHLLTAIWTATDSHDSEELHTLDAAYQLRAKNLAADPQINCAVLNSFRTDVTSVHLCIKGKAFSKTYALNRFLVHLLEQCSKNVTRKTGTPFFNVVRDVTLTAVNNQGFMKTLTFSNGAVFPAEVVIIRFGADRSQIPGQWLGLTVRDTENRRELAAVPLPLYLPPSR